MLLELRKIFDALDAGFFPVVTFASPPFEFRQIELDDRTLVRTSVRTCDAYQSKPCPDKDSGDGHSPLPRLLGDGIEHLRRFRRAGTPALPLEGMWDFAPRFRESAFGAGAPCATTTMTTATPKSTARNRCQVRMSSTSPVANNSVAVRHLVN